MGWIVTSLGLLLSSVVLFAWTRWITSPRLEKPLSVVAPGQFHLPVHIRVSDRYFLYLYFNRMDASFETLRSLVGGPYGQTLEVDGKKMDAGEPPGLPIPLRWSLEEVHSGLVAASGESAVLGSNSWSAAEVGRLLHQCEIDAGRYTFKGEVLRGVPEFRNIRARLALELLPKHAHSWAMAFYWWGSVLAPLLLLGAMLSALAAIVLWT